MLDYSQVKESALIGQLEGYIPLISRQQREYKSWGLYLFPIAT